jgi:hypothetical protein
MNLPAWWKDLSEKLSDNILVVVMAAVALFGVVGYRFYPPGDRILSWSEFKGIMERGDFDAELAALRGKATQLSFLLTEDHPDPLKAAQLADQIKSLTGLESLAKEREALVEAAAAVQSWASGALSRDEAIAKLDAAITMLELATP